MPRYFIEVSYMGTNYAGSQRQGNANTVQFELEKALHTYFKSSFELTGSSRTDAGVHAKQNFYHFDRDYELESEANTKSIYHLNAILPADIVIQSIILVPAEAHCRFDALARTYEYALYWNKNPFLDDRAYYYPFPLDLSLLNAFSRELLNHVDFQTFAKKNSQVHTFNCKLHTSEWVKDKDAIIYRVKANRFLRGMVKGLVGTMLRSCNKGLSIDEFAAIISAKNPTSANFAVPSRGLLLQEVQFDTAIFGCCQRG